MMVECYRQGQRDREQGWPAMPDLWCLVGLQARAYLLGYAHPRV